MLDAAQLAMRVTNAGILGNAFFDIGRSFDPSLEFPRGSGHEALGHAELWVGARTQDGVPRVSGGPMLEWRPTRDPADRVVASRAGQPGSIWNLDDDHDGRVDEDPLNGQDDDGDGRVDEDYGMVADQLLASTYTDDQPEATSFAYPNGEAHVPLHLAVRQEAMAWSRAEFGRVAGYRFVITNRGGQTLRDVRLGLYCDLDSRNRNDPAGHLNDLVVNEPYDAVIPEGTSTIKGLKKTCVTHFEGSVPVVYDGVPTSGLPASCVVGLSHTTDPLGFLNIFAFPGAEAAAASARAPYRDTTFRYRLFAQDRPPGGGGPPIVDADRFAALGGEYPEAAPEGTHDWVVLLCCGPFARLDPGQEVEFEVAFIAGPEPDSLASSAVAARMLWRGTRYNVQPDGKFGEFFIGETGINGHETCYEPPPGITFNYDPNCPLKFYRDPAYEEQLQFNSLDWLFASELTYGLGHCIWTDFDCDACTGLDGKETHVPWQVGGLFPPKPAVRVNTGGGGVSVGWDNTPEIMLAQPGGWDAGYQFGGYRVYRLDDWRRETILPSPDRWQRIAAFRPATLAFAGALLDSIVDRNVIADGTLYGAPHYPAGRYRMTDPEVKFGFDYLYVVTTIMTKLTLVNGLPVLTESESPLTASFGDRITPHAPARPSGGEVWVVPNPYHASAPWERSSIPGDVFTRHIDFFGLPRALAVIRIYTLAGDLVARLDHDGRAGDGEASWNLISRNGQDVASGVYLFTVSSALGHQVGRFVIMR